MRKLIIPFLLLFLAAVAGIVSAAELIHPNEEGTAMVEVPIDDDVYIAGGRIVTSAQINGDLLAAGGEVSLNSPVNGDLMLAGGSMRVLTTILGDARIAGGEIDFQGTIGEDAIVTGGDIEIQGEVGQDVYVSGGDVEIRAIVGRDAQISAGNVYIDGTFGRNVTIEAGSVTFGPNTKIQGNLLINAKDISGLTPEMVDGEAIKKSRGSKKEYHKSYDYYKKNKFDDKVISVIVAILLGLLIVGIMPRKAAQIAENISHKPFSSLGLGFIFLIGIPIAAVLSMVFIITIPISILVLVLYAFALYVSPLFVAYALGIGLVKVLNKKPSRFLVIILGVLVFAIIKLIPILGGIVVAFAVLLGLGAMTMACFQKKRGAENKTNTKAAKPLRKKAKKANKSSAKKSANRRRK